MKKYLLGIIAIVFSIISLAAQEIEIHEEQVLIEKALTSAWVFEVSEDPAVIMKLFMDFTSNNFELDPKKKKNKSVLIEQSVVPGISDKSGDLWLVFNTDQVVRASMAFLLGYDIAINSEDYPEEMEGMKGFALEFIVYYKTTLKTEQIEDITDRLEGLKKSLAKQQSTSGDLSKQIAKTEKKLLKESDEEKKFELNNENVELKSKITASNQIIENTKDEINSVTQVLKTLNNDLTRIKMQAIEENSGI